MGRGWGWDRLCIGSPGSPQAVSSHAVGELPQAARLPVLSDSALQNQSIRLRMPLTVSVGPWGSFGITVPQFPHVCSGHCDLHPFMALGGRGAGGEGCRRCPPLPVPCVLLDRKRLWAVSVDESQESRGHTVGLYTDPPLLGVGTVHASDPDPVCGCEVRSPGAPGSLAGSPWPRLHADWVVLNHAWDWPRSPGRVGRRPRLGSAQLSGRGQEDRGRCNEE